MAPVGFANLTHLMGIKYYSLVAHNDITYSSITDRDDEIKAALSLGTQGKQKVF